MIWAALKDHYWIFVIPIQRLRVGRNIRGTRSSLTVGKVASGVHNNPASRRHTIIIGQPQPPHGPMAALRLMVRVVEEFSLISHFM
jgi:hypothetical protein